MPARTRASKTEPTVDTGVVKAIGHPLRMKLLGRLNETVASPVELARELNESVQLVSYHVRILRDLGFVELVGTTPRRGAIEHHYRAVRRPMFTDADWGALPANARTALAGETVEQLFRHAAEALESGAFEVRTDTHASFVDLTLDEEGWQTLAGRLNQVLADVAELEAEAAERIGEGAPAIPSRLAMLLYPGAPSEDGKAPAANRRTRKTKQRTKRS